MNTIKLGFLMSLLTVLLVTFGRILGGPGGMTFAFMMAIVMNFGAYWFSDKMVLRMYRAQEVQPGDDPLLYSIVERLAGKAGLPMPKVYIIPDESSNAFATGRNPENSAVAVTAGIRRLLTEEELSGVIGHELAHIKNRDILIATVAATFAGAITMLANMAQWAMIFGGGRSDERGGNPWAMLLTAILAPIASTLIQMAISRSREYQADKVGAEIHGRPTDLASALAKLHNFNVNQIGPRDANPATAHMFIDSPLSGRSFSGLFSTHPQVEERIRRLQAMS